MLTSGNKWANLSMRAVTQSASFAYCTQHFSPLGSRDSSYSLSKHLFINQM